MPGKMPRPSGAWQIPSSTSLCGAMAGDVLALEADACRCVTGRRPEMVFRVVVLPAPLAPMRVTISPSSTVRLTPRSACDLAVVDVDVVELKKHRSATPR